MRYIFMLLLSSVLKAFAINMQPKLYEDNYHIEDDTNPNEYKIDEPKRKQ
jgi:hypothetical protein